MRRLGLEVLESKVVFFHFVCGDLEGVAAAEYDGFVGEGLTTEDYHTESHTGCTPNRLDRKTAGEDGELCWSWPDCGLDEPPSSCGKT